ncbi:MAG: signal peptidase I [Pseudomonadota bacterium]
MIPPFAYIYVKRPWYFVVALLISLALVPSALHLPILWLAFAITVALHAASIALWGRDRRGERWYAQPIGLLACLALTTSAAAAARTFVFDIYRVSSGSMEPSLQINDLVFVRKWEDLEIARGQIYVFRFAGEDHVSVKRLVGLPGDAVSMSGNYLTVDNRDITQQAVDATEGEISLWETLDGHRYPILDLYDIKRFRRDFHLGKDEFFFLGDNRSNSIDSRIKGSVMRASIIGVVARFPAMRSF